MNNKKYLYIISYRREFKELCKLEMKYLFNACSSLVYNHTNEDIGVSRSTFIKGRINILYQDTDITNIEKALIKDEMCFDQYKIEYIKNDTVEYQDRLQAMRILGTAIEGDFAIKDPLVELAVTKIDGLWVFGYYLKNKHEWVERRNKPFNYSHAIEVKLAKTLINIGIGNSHTLSLVDPCCGVGTIIIEARAQDLNIEGFDIQRLVVNNCNANLEHFKMEPNVKRLDMQLIDKSYDVAFLDLPYGLFSKITLDGQVDLIRKAHSISKKLILISMEDMTDSIKKLNISIENKIQIKKSNAFSRYITVCI